MGDEDGRAVYYYDKSIAKFGIDDYYNFFNFFNSYVSITFRLVAMKMIYNTVVNSL